MASPDAIDTSTIKFEDSDKQPNADNDPTTETIPDVNEIEKENSPETVETTRTVSLTETRKWGLASIEIMLKSGFSMFMIGKKKVPPSENVESQDGQTKSHASGVNEKGLTSVREDEASKKGSTKESSKWGLSSIGTILQVVFYVIVIGQNVSGLWKIDSSRNAPENAPLTPRYVELRSDMYGHERQFDEDNSPSAGVMGLLFGPTRSPVLPANTGIPKEQHIALTLLNREYETYRYSVRAATKSKAVASTEFGQASFQRALEKALFRFSDQTDKMRLTIIEDRFLGSATSLVDKILDLRASIGNNSTTFDHDQCNATNSSSTYPFDYSNEVPQCRSQPNANTTDLTEPNTTSNSTILISTLTTNATNSTLRMINETYSAICGNVTLFLEEVSLSFPPIQANQIKDVIVGHNNMFGCDALVNDLRKSPMRMHFSARKRRLFVLSFFGDLFATAVSDLRKEVTAIVLSAEAGDEVLVVLQSGGGTVTGYGLVAAQLLRIKHAGLKLTIAVEQVAASGGYMAACVADTIICSPFAVLGSIGVIQEMPSLYERLKREGVEFHQITAGDWKRVLSPTKQATDEDLKKAKEDVEDVWQLFKDFVAEQRPSLNIDRVATGEVWFGKRALEVGLCDDIQASDDILTDYVNRGYDVYNVKHQEPMEDIFEKIWNPCKDSSTSSIFGLLFYWLLQKAASVLQRDGVGYLKYKEKVEHWSTILLA